MGKVSNPLLSMDAIMEIIRAPNFSRWLCQVKRKSSFTWRHLADYLDVSAQCIDSYATGRSHPQIMRFHLLIQFISRETGREYNTLLIDAYKYIKQDSLLKHGK